MTPAEVLSRYPLFALIPSELQRQWLAGGQGITLAAGDVLFQEGSPGNWGYVLLAGKVRVLRRSPSKKEVSLGSIGPGELLGEYALLAPGHNTATCRAVNDSVLWQFPLAPIREWITFHRPVAAQLKNWLRLHFLLRHLRGQSALGFQSGPSALAMLGHLHAMTIAPLRAIQAGGFCDELWFFIESGEVLLSDEEPTCVLKAGDTLGELALAGERPPTAVALSETRVQALPREFFLRPDQPMATGFEQSLVARVLEHPEQIHYVGQREATDCGAASLSMVARYHGLSCGIDDIRSRLTLGPRGATLAELARVANAVGFEAQPVRVGPHQLGFVQVPAIIHQAGDHYVVLFRLNDSSAMLGDPASGVVTRSALHFAERATGHVLLLRRAITMSA